MPELRYYEAIAKETVRLLQQERESRNLSRYAVAQQSGVSESMLSLVERGLRNPSMELLLRMADGIGVDFPVLLTKAMASVKKEKRRGR